LWVRTGRAKVEKDGVSLLITSRQNGDCVVNIKQEKAHEAKRKITEALYIGGTVKNGECRPGQKPEEMYFVGPAGTICNIGGKKNNACSLSREDLLGLEKILPIGTPLQNKVNGLIKVIDLLLKVKRELAKKYGVEVPESGKLSEKIWAGVGYTFWTLQDWVHAIVPHATKEDRTKFGIYLHDTILALENLKAMLERGVDPDLALEMYKNNEYPDPENPDKYIKGAGSTEFTYELLKLVDENGKIDPFELFDLAEEFRKEGEKLADWWKFEYLKNDFYAQYYLATELAMEMIKYMPVEGRSVNFLSDGKTSLSNLLHTKTLLDRPKGKGKAYYVAWSGDLKRIIDDVKVTLADLKAKEQQTIPLPMGAYQASAFLISYEIALKNGETLPVNLEKGEETLKILTNEYNELLALEKKEPRIARYGKLYDEAMKKQRWEDIKDFFAQWVDPFLIADAAFTLSKYSLKGLRFLSSLRGMDFGTNLGLVKSLSYLDSFLKNPKILLRSLMKGKYEKLFISGRIDEMYELIEKNFGKTFAKEFGDDVQDVLENFDEAFMKTLIGAEAKEKPLEIIFKEPKSYEIVLELLGINQPIHPGSAYYFLRNELLEGGLGAIKVGEKYYTWAKIGKEKVPIFFVKKSELEKISYAFSKERPTFGGVTVSDPFHEDIVTVFIPIEDEVLKKLPNFEKYLKTLVEDPLNYKMEIALKEKNYAEYLEELMPLEDTFLHERDHGFWHSKERKIFKGVRKTIFDEDTLETLATISPVVDDPRIAKVSFSSKFSAGSIYRKAQTDFMAEFIKEFGERAPPKVCEFCHKVVKMDEEAFKKLKELALQRPYSYNIMRENAIKMLDYVNPEELRGFAKYYYRNVAEKALAKEEPEIIEMVKGWLDERLMGKI